MPMDSPRFIIIVIFVAFIDRDLIHINNELEFASNSS